MDDVELSWVLGSVLVVDFVLMEFFSMIQSAESKCLLSRAINRGFGLILPYFFVNSNSFSCVFESSFESSLMATESNVEFTFRLNRRLNSDLQSLQFYVQRLTLPHSFVKYVVYSFEQRKFVDSVLRTRILRV